MSRAKPKAPVLTLDSAQEQAAQQIIKRFLEDRFELELGSFEAQEVLDLFAREIFEEAIEMLPVEPIIEEARLRSRLG